MKCIYCGQELAEGSIYCNYCGKPQTESGQPAGPAPQAVPKREAAPAPASPERNVLKCPKCGSTRLQFVTKVKTKGVSVSDACCGYIILGPLGLLCGLCGAGSSDTEEGWVCQNCGVRFTTKDAQNAVKAEQLAEKANQQREQNEAKKQQEKETQLAAWRAMMDNCPYPPDQLDSLYEEASRQEEEQNKIFRDQCNTERKAVARWQAAFRWMTAGAIVFLLGAAFFLFCLLYGGPWGAGLLIGLIGLVLAIAFSAQDDQLFDQYASEGLRAMKQQKEQATQRKDELKKYREAYQGLKAEDTGGGKA